jgi:homoserine kinase type II
MSVYTRVDRDQLTAFLQGYQIGELVEFHGIVAGVTNSNYAVQTSVGKYVLTLYENHSLEALDYILSLQHHLEANGVACASPVPDHEGRLYSALNNRPAAIIYRLPGDVCKNPSTTHCAAIGAELARFHLCGRSFIAHRDNPCGIDWCLDKARKLNPYLADPDRLLIQEEINSYQKCSLENLPTGTVHADLFHDNALFEDDRLSGIIDFDYACNDAWVYDLCITINDWCLDASGEIDPQLKGALLQAYQQIRPLLEQEHAIMPLMFRIGAFRFWLSRLYDKTFPVGGELTFVKNPDDYKNLLIKYRHSVLLSG